MLLQGMKKEAEGLTLRLLLASDGYLGFVEDGAAGEAAAEAY